MKKIIFVFTILFSLNLNAGIFFVNGNELLAMFEAEKRVNNAVSKGKEVDSNDLYDFKRLTGYLEGVVDTGDEIFFCLNKDVRLKQLGDIAHKTLKDHPEIRHKSAALILAASWKKVFPCPETKK